MDCASGILPERGKSRGVGERLDTPAGQQIAEAVLKGVSKLPAGHDRASECAKRRKDVRMTLKQIEKVLEKIDDVIRLKGDSDDFKRKEYKLHARRAQWCLDRCDGLTFALQNLQVHDRLSWRAGCGADAGRPPASAAATGATRVPSAEELGTSPSAPEAAAAPPPKVDTPPSTMAAVAAEGVGEPHHHDSFEALKAEYALLDTEVDSIREQAFIILRTLEGSSFSFMRGVGLMFLWVTTPLTTLGCAVGYCATKGDVPAAGKIT